MPMDAVTSAKVDDGGGMAKLDSKPA